MSIAGTTRARDGATPTVGSPARGRRSSRVRFRVATVTLAAIAGIVASLGSLVVFPYLSQNSDEGAYLLQMRSLRAGDLVPNAPAVLPELFQPWFSVLRDGHFVFKYAPVHAAMLAMVPDALGGPRFALGLIAAAAAVLIVALARELGAGRRGAFAAGVVLVCCPVVVVQSWTFLPYLGSLVLLLAFAVAVRRGARTGRPWLILVAGVVLGIAFWARPYDALLFATPMVVWQAVRCRRRADPATLVQLLGWLALGAVPGVLGFLGYNALTTGSPLRLPFRLQEQSDNLGFGERRTNQVEPFFDYTADAAWRGTVENARLLLTWSFGSVMLVVLGVYGAFVHPLARCRWLLVAWLAVWPVGFFFFWGTFSYVFRWDGGRYLGPYYYLPVLVPLAIGAGLGIERVLTHARWPVVIFGLAATALALPVLVGAIDGNLARTDHRRAIAQAVDRAVDDTPRRAGALVLVPGVWGRNLQHPFSFLRNAPGYDGDRVYALESGDLDLVLAAQFPGRDVVTISLPEGYRDGTSPVDSPAWVERQSVVRGGAVQVGVDGIRTSTPLALRIAAGARHVDVPIDASGSARVTLAASDGGVAAQTGGDRVILPTGGGARLSASLVRPLGTGGAQTLEHRLVPYTIEEGTMALMWPGTVDASVLRPAQRSAWSARAVDASLPATAPATR